MRTLRFVIVLHLSSLLFTATTFTTVQVNRERRELTFGEVRTLLAGQKIVINSYTFGGDLTDWYPATLRGEVYVADYLSRYLPASYKGSEAEVIAVQLNNARSRAGAASALKQP